MAIEVMKLWFTSMVVSFVSLVLYYYYIVWLQPEKMREKLRRQGIRGPPPSLLYGNMLQMKRNYPEEEKARDDCPTHISHNYIPLLFPYLEQWRKEYGPLFMYSKGNIVMLSVGRPDLVKEIGLNTGLNFGKPTYLKKEHKILFGDGIMRANGQFWAHQRKLMAPEFFMEKVKGMVDLMVQSTIPLLESWASKIESEGGMADMKVDEDLRNLSADVISKACFGSSYVEGNEIFTRLRALQDAISNQNLVPGLPFLRCLPSKKNRKIGLIEREVKSMILKLVKERREEPRSEKDFLHSIIEESNHENIKNGAADQFIVDNCKTIFFAGHETAAVSALWTLMLLALNHKWQDQARSEVQNICGSHLPNADSIRQMKILTMVIQESLRLYPPATLVARETLEDMHLGGFHLPKGLNLWMPASVLHHDREIWGPDAGEFNPARFTHGVLRACQHPHVYMPFGVGSRTCLGQNLAMVELKVVLALIISRFNISLSPEYCHSPSLKMVLEPGHGMRLLLRTV